MISQSITIGIVADQYNDYKNYEYMLSLINLQTIKDNVNIIISIDKYDGINIAEIIDLINAMEFPPNRVRIRYNKKRVGIEENITWIKKNCGTDYCLILRNNDAFYESDSLEKMITGTRNCNYQSSIVVVNSNGQFIKMVDETVMFNTSAISCIKKCFIGKYSREDNNTYNVGAVLRRIENDNDDRELLYKDDYSHLEMNHNDYLYFLNIKNNKLMIEEGIKTVFNNAKHSKWGITDSKKCLLSTLEKSLNREHSYVNPSVSQKIKLLFLLMEFSCFPSVQKIVDYAQEDERFEVDLVYVPFSHPNKTRSDDEEMESYKKCGYKLIRHMDYDLPKRSPDVAFMIKPYNLVPPKFYTSEIFLAVDRIIFIKYCPDAIDVKDSKSFDNSFYRSSLNYVAWKNYCSSKKIYKGRVKKAWKDAGDNWEFEGHFRGDIDLATIKKSFPKETSELLNRARSRKILFWNSQHYLVGEGSTGTFLKIGESMLTIMSEYTSLFFIWRPHPLFWGALENAKGKEYVQTLRDFLKAKENIYIDEFDSYLPALYLSDGMISDMSSLIGEYLLTQKPVCFLYSDKGCNIYPKEYLRSLYVADSADEFAAFLDKIKKGIDVKRAERLKVISQNFKINNTNQAISKTVLDNIYRSLTCGVPN